MLTSALNSQKTSGGLGDLYINDWKDEGNEKLERVSCIWYPIIFKDQTEALLNSGSKINAISQTFAH